MVQNARVRKTKMFFEDRNAFMALLVDDVKTVIRRASKANMIPLIRLNGTSDLPFENFRVVVDGIGYRNIMSAFPEVQFYDYTAIVGRSVPDNYHLTFSKKENNDKDVNKAIDAGMNVAVVFSVLPETYMGLPVISGDETDIRINDLPNVIIGLKAKGNAKRDKTGFVVK